MVNGMEGLMYNEMQKKDEDLINKAHELLRLWESEDPETRMLWEKMRKWAIDGFKETYKIFNISHEKTYKESEIYDKGKEIVLLGLKKKIFENYKPFPHKEFLIV